MRMRRAAIGEPSVALAVGAMRRFRREQRRLGAVGPVTIGASLSLSGDFSADGQAFQRGYELWAADQNRKGGLLGHHDQAADPLRRELSRRRSSPTTTR